MIRSRNVQTDCNGKDERREISSAFSQPALNSEIFKKKQISGLLLTHTKTGYFPEN